MPRRKRRPTRRRGLVIAVLAIGVAALAWLLWPSATSRKAERSDAPVIAPSGPRETIEEADREALRDLLERKRSR